ICLLPALGPAVLHTLSLHDALPIYYLARNLMAFFKRDYRKVAQLHIDSGWVPAETKVNEFEADPYRVRADLREAAEGHLLRSARSEEHTSELQSRENLVCRLLLEKK